MNLDFKSIVLMLLLTTVNLLNMEETSYNHLLKNFTQFTHPTTQTYINNISEHNINNKYSLNINMNNLGKNISFENRRDSGPENEFQYLKIPGDIKYKTKSEVTDENTKIITYRSNYSRIIQTKDIENNVLKDPTSYMIYPNETTITNLDKKHQLTHKTYNSTQLTRSGKARRLNQNTMQRRNRNNKIKNRNRKTSFDEYMSYLDETGSNSNGYNVYEDKHYKEEPRDYEDKKPEVQYWDEPSGSDPLRYHHDPVALHSHKEIAVKPETNKPTDEETKKEDKKAIEKLHDMYYCNKYCHCCKKKVHHEHNHERQSRFEPNHHFLYGRRSDDSIIESLDLPQEPKTDDGSFVFFNKEEDEASGVTQCKNVCGCCENIKKIKLKNKMKEMKKEEEKREEALKGVTGVIKQLLSSDSGNADPEDNSKRRKARSLLDEDKKFDKIGYLPKYAGVRRHEETYPSTDIEPHGIKDYHDEHDHDIEHHDHHKSFDCSKCCQFCETPEEKKKKRRKQQQVPFGVAGEIDLLDLLSSLITGKPALGETDDTFAPEYNDGDFSFTGTGGQNYDYIGNYAYFEPGTIPSGPSNSTCCVNSTLLFTTIPVVTTALMALNAVSALNAGALTVIPLGLFGATTMFVFFSIQASAPALFIPIFIILTGVLMVPTAGLLLVPLLSSAFLAPSALSALQRIPGNKITTNAPSCIGTNCTTLDTVNNYPIYPELDDSTEILLETTTMVDTNYITQPTSVEVVNEGRQLKIPISFLRNMNAVLVSDRCLERAGCHLAVYTHSVSFYNKFMIRIMEHLALNDTRYVTYKDAYKIGSLQITTHEKCVGLYFCTEYKRFIYK